MSSLKTSPEYISHRGNKPEPLKTPIATSALSPVSKISVKHRINGSTSPSVVQRNSAVPRKVSPKDRWTFMCTVNGRDFEIFLTKDRMCIAATSYDYKKSKLEYEQLDDSDLFTVIDPANHILKFKLGKRDSVAFRDTYGKFGHISCKSRRVILPPDFGFTAWENISKKYVKVLVKANGVFLEHPAKVFHWWDSKFNLKAHGTNRMLRVKSVNSGDMLDLTASPTEQRYFADLVRHIQSQGRLDTSAPGKSKEVPPNSFYAEGRSQKTARESRLPTSTSSPKTQTNFLLNNSSKTPLLFAKKRRLNDAATQAGDVGSLGSQNGAISPISSPRKSSEPPMGTTNDEDDVFKDGPRASKSETNTLFKDKLPQSGAVPTIEPPRVDAPKSEPSKAGHSEGEPPKERRRRCRQSVVYLDNDPEMLVEPTLEDYELLRAENYKRVAYRFWDGKSTEVALEDIARLNPHVYVNDTIIWFFLRYFMERLVARDAKTASHILLLDTFFYSTLRQGDPPSWILKIPLTTKDILIMPIHDHAHWSAAIIVGLRKMFHTQKNGSLGDSESEDLEGEEAFKPTIVILDSLGGTNSRHAGRKVVTALANALKAQSMPPLSPKQFRILRGDVPTQPNSTDCGVYLIHFVEQILSDPQELLKRVDTSHNGVLNIDEGYWKPNEAWRKRIELKTLLKGLGNQDDVPQTTEELDCIEVVEVENVANRRKAQGKSKNDAKKLALDDNPRLESGGSQVETSPTKLRTNPAVGNSEQLDPAATDPNRLDNTQNTPDMPVQPHSEERAEPGVSQEPVQPENPRSRAGSEMIEQVEDSQEPKEPKEPRGSGVSAEQPPNLTAGSSLGKHMERSQGTKTESPPVIVEPQAGRSSHGDASKPSKWDTHTEPLEPEETVQPNQSSSVPSNVPTSPLRHANISADQ